MFRLTTCARRPRGFTVVELMIVVAIIALLMALLLPAINAARESGRRTVCLNQMRELASAVQQFEGAKGHYPGWRNFFRVVDHHQLPQASWPVMVLPYLSRTELYENFRQNGPTLKNCIPLNELLVCPSDFDKVQDLRGATSYVGNTGRIDRFDRATANNLPPDSRTNGVFLHVYDHNNNNIAFR